jgi:hypothetical protein
MSTTTEAQPHALATGRLVCWAISSDHPRDAVVLHPDVLGALTIDRTELLNAGWRLIELPNTGARLLARATGAVRWCAAWQLYVDVVAVHEVDTVAVETADGRGAIVAALGARTTIRAIARRD